MKKLWLFLLILSGTSLWLLTTFRSGLPSSFGYGFWGPQGHDGIWHLAVINQMSSAPSPANPVFSGHSLTNYHWGFDYFAFFLHRFTDLSLLDLYFRVIPIFFAVSIGLLSYALALAVSKRFSVAWIFTFLVYFCGSFGWLVTLLRQHRLGGESLFWSMQSVSTLINPPYALSLVLLLAGLLLWQKNRHRPPLWGLLVGLPFGLLAGVKIYAAIIFAFSFLVFWLLDFFRHRRFFTFEFFLGLSFFGAFIFFAKLFGLFSSESLLVFQPLWFAHRLIDSPDKLFLPWLSSLHYNLSLNPFTWKLPVLLAIELFLLVVFLIGNLGLRLLALPAIFRRRPVSDFNRLILISLAVSLVVPLLFIQKGTAWNTIQFFYYFLFFTNYYAAVFLSRHLSRPFFLAALLLFSLPTSLGTISDYLGNPPPAALPPSEIEALDFLRRQPPGVVLAPSFDPYRRQNLPTPLPLYLYETTAYLSAFSGHQIFLADEMNLEITNFDWRSRRQSIQNFFLQNYDERFQNRDLLINNYIDYIYLVGYQKYESRLSHWNMQLDLIFDNPQVSIYRVRK